MHSCMQPNKPESGRSPVLEAEKSVIWVLIKIPIPDQKVVLAIGVCVVRNFHRDQGSNDLHSKPSVQHLSILAKTHALQQKRSTS